MGKKQFWKLQWSALTEAPKYPAMGSSSGWLASDWIIATI
jgi:hypothetical protein